MVAHREDLDASPNGLDSSGTDLSESRHVVDDVVLDFFGNEGPSLQQVRDHTGGSCSTRGFSLRCAVLVQWVSPPSHGDPAKPSTSRVVGLLDLLGAADDVLDLVVQLFEILFQFLNASPVTAPGPALPTVQPRTARPSTSSTEVPRLSLQQRFLESLQDAKAGGEQPFQRPTLHMDNRRVHLARKQALEVVEEGLIASEGRRDGLDPHAVRHLPTATSRILVPELEVPLPKPHIELPFGIHLVERVPREEPGCEDGSPEPGRALG
mmetsp:Transcript_22239/g.64597  ORF Transcript_22239/g.64597 Transcript_22239/m.64597 type:complete len:266 (-) Transcript_22239:92-889(-)